MKFFVPLASGDETEKEYDAIVTFAESQTAHVDRSRRIFRLHFRHDGVDQEAEVGQVFGPLGEPVIAILKSVTYLICTYSRGVRRGLPVLVGENEVRSFEDFDAT